MAGDFNMGNQSQVLRPTRENEQEKLDPANELGRNFSAPENEHLLERILTIMSNSYSFNISARDFHCVSINLKAQTQINDD